MSKQEIVNAYMNGRMSRREFVARLTGAGVSVAAASAYAISLASPAAARGISHSPGGYLQLNQEGEYDSDGDGVSDAKEAECGSDPFDPESFCQQGELPTPTPEPGEPTPTPGSGSGGEGGAVTDLPKTGSGGSASESSEWWKPAAIVSVGAAAFAARFKKKPASSN